MSQRRKHLIRAVAALGLITTVMVVPTATPATAGFAESLPIFTKAFAPDTIGPGSVSTLTFTINNTANPPRTSLAFTDVLPAGMTIADPANASTTCAPNGAVGPTLTAPAGGATITFSDGAVGAAQVCVVRVDVTSSAVGTNTNTSGALTSTAGTSGSATDDLVVDASLPGFSKSFAPASVPLGGRSTLTLTIDNSSNDGSIPNLDFTDSLPAGMTIASPPNAATTCGTATIPPTLTAAAGGTTITLDADGTSNGFPAVAGGGTCTVTVDVNGGATGSLFNSTELLAEFVSAGKATAVLNITGSALAIAKSFSDDPVPPGGTVTLDFTITNNDRGNAATDIAFSDDLEAALAGLVATGATANTCGGMASSVFPTGLFVYEGGNLAPGASCTISLTLGVPGGPVTGTYVNTTSPVTGIVGGSAVIGNTANDTLFVVAYPLLTKEFLADPVGAGDTVTLEFTITNTSATAPMTDIEFLDKLTDGSGGLPPDPTTGFLPFPVSVTLPPVPDPPCGAGSSLALSFVDFDRQALGLTGGSLATAGSPGDSCTFQVDVDIPAGFPAGTYLNTTEEISGVVGGTTMVGPVASDDVVIVGAPTLRKDFTDDPVNPGDSVNLQFTIEHDALASADATAIAFTDDLTATLAGLTATAVTANTCGATVDIATPATIAVTGGTLVPGADCTIDVTLLVPAGAAQGIFPNTTSELTATVDGVSTTGTAAEDNLQIATLVLTKEFLENPYIPGVAGTLRFTLDNQGATDATGASFTDDLDAALTGLAATGGAVGDTCGGALSGTTSLAYIGGAVTAGSSCTFDVPILVPADAADGTYSNVTSIPSSSLGDSAPAVAPLVVDATLLQITKEFTDDPVAPGDAVSLDITLTNLSATETVTDIAFSDDLDAALTGLEATGAALNTCGGMASSIFPTGLFVYEGGTLSPGASCTISLVLTVPAGPLAGSSFTNTIDDVAGKVGALDVVGDPASDNLEVQSQTLTKSFDGPTAATGTADLTFTITNLDSSSSVNGLSFTDNLDAVITGLVATALPATPCGTGSAVSGSGFLSLTGASLAAGASCTFTVTVTVPSAVASGSYTNTTSTLFANGLPIADPAIASLTIEPAPTLTKEFAPDTIVATTTSTMTLTIDHSAGTADASGLTFTDNLPAGMVTGTPANASTTCTGGTLTAADATGTVSYTGGSVAAGTTCEISVDVTSATDGVFINTTGNLTSSYGNSGTATDTLTVTPLVPPTFTKAFAPDTIVADTTSILTFTVDNSASTLPATGLAFTDSLPGGTTLATPANASTTCTGGTLTAADATGTVSYTGGSVAAGATCEISVDVTSAVADTYVNTTGDLTSSLGNSGTATDTLTVTPRTPPTVTIEQAAGQADPTNVAPINFTVVFSEPVTGFDSAGVTVVNGTVASVIAGAGNSFAVAVTPTADGLVTATVPAGVAVDDENTPNLASTSTDNTVNYDSTLPVINLPGSPLTVNNDPGEAGAVVTYIVTTTDEGTTTGEGTTTLTLSARLVAEGESAPIVQPGGLVCTPPSGSFFPLGTTVVTCTATDAAGNTSTATFNIVVVDNEDPVIAAAPNVVRTIPTGVSVAVTFPTPAATDNSGSASVVCVPASSSTFNVGTTTVTCTARDAAGNTAATSFTVRVTSSAVLPETGGGLDGLTIALQFFLAGIALLAISRLRSRRRLAVR
jgi:uncharacterized repeat protein (TIGR01451 family)